MPSTFDDDGLADRLTGPFRKIIEGLSELMTVLPAELMRMAAEKGVDFDDLDEVSQVHVLGQQAGLREAAQHITIAFAAKMEMDRAEVDGEFGG
jgi:hypothetical protein